MNIFYLHTDRFMNAQYHVDRHVMKMPIETTQMLSTVLRERFNVDAPTDGPGKIYRSAYITHPCTRWVGETYDNFVWTWFFGTALCDEFLHRYGKVHACRQVLSTISNIMPSPDTWPGDPAMTPRPKCVAPEFKHLDVITAYRMQYITKKARLHSWTNRPVPNFVQDQSWTEEV
jgi:hypothetical protein